MTPRRSGPIMPFCPQPGVSDTWDIVTRVCLNDRGLRGHCDGSLQGLGRSLFAGCQCHGNRQPAAHGQITHPYECDLRGHFKELAVHWVRRENGLITREAVERILGVRSFSSVLCLRLLSVRLL